MACRGQTTHGGGAVAVLLQPSTLKTVEPKALKAIVVAVPVVLLGRFPPLPMA
jgi:hypothetical protein